MTITKIVTIIKIAKCSATHLLNAEGWTPGVGFGPGPGGVGPGGLGGGFGSQAPSLWEVSKGEIVAPSW